MAAEAPKNTRDKANAAASREAPIEDAVATAAAGEVWPTILQVVPKLNSGGVERGAIEIADAIRIAGGAALVASEGGRMVPQLEAVGGELIRMPAASKNPLKLRANARRLVELIGARSVSVVHARSRAPAWSALWATRRTKTPFVTTYHGAYNEGLPFKRAYNSVMAKGDVVIAISQHIRDLIRERHGTPEERIVVIPRGADLNAFSEAATSMARVSALAADWGVFHDPRPIVAFPGRLTRWKGQTLFIEALALVRERLGDQAFCAAIVGADEGDGAFQAELEGLVAAHGLSDVVRLVGHCEDMPAAYRLASVVATASLEPEAFGRVPVEAMAMGAPVIAPAHGGALETVDDGVTGWLFEPGEAEPLAQAIRHAIEIGPEGRKTIGAAGVKRVRAGFSVERMQASTIEVYQRVLEERRASGA